VRVDQQFERPTTAALVDNTLAGVSRIKRQHPTYGLPNMK
jgi:hypothetical protein